MHAPVRLDSNQSPFGTSGAVRRAWERQRTADIRKYGLNRYPDFYNTDMLAALAQQYGLTDANYTVLADPGEGGNVLAAALLRERGAEVLEPWPVTDLVSHPAAAWGATVRRVALGPRRPSLLGLAAAVGRHTRLVHVQNPHDPTGWSFGEAELERLLAAVAKRNPRAYVWVDESLAPYSTRADFPNSFELIGRNLESSRLIVMRTLGTAAGIAGDATAYMAASQKLTYYTQGIEIGSTPQHAHGWKNPECTVDRMGEKAMLALLTPDGDSWLAHVRERNAAARAELVRILRGHRLEFVQSDASFVLARAPDRLGGGGLARALRGNRVLVRAPDGWGPGYRNWVRISVGSGSELRGLDGALGRVLGKRSPANHRAWVPAPSMPAGSGTRRAALGATAAAAVAIPLVRRAPAVERLPEAHAALELTRRQLIRRGALGAAGATVLLAAMRAGRADAYPPDSYYDQHNVARMLYHENPAGPSPAALEAVGAVIARGPASYARLQESDQADLVDAVLAYNRLRSAAAHRLRPENVMLMHGSAEGLTLTADTFVGDGTIVSEWPAYYVVRQRVWQAGGTVVDVPLRRDTWQPDYAALKRALHDHPRAGLVHFNAQNNPTGRALDRGSFDDFCRYVFERHPHIVILADESDHEFMSTGPARNIPDFAAYVSAGENFVHLQTFSHAFALTGLRIGYLLAPRRLIDRMAARRIPRPVNVFGHAAALATLADRSSQIKRSYELIDHGREYLYAELTKMGLRYLSSQGGYVMVDTGRNGDAVFGQLWGLGVLTRAGSTWDMDSWIRVCPGQPDENRRFIDSLRTVLAQPDPRHARPPLKLDDTPLGKAFERNWRRERAIRRVAGPPRYPYRVTQAAAFPGHPALTPSRYVEASRASSRPRFDTATGSTTGARSRSVVRARP